MFMWEWHLILLLEDQNSNDFVLEFSQYTIWEKDYYSMEILLDNNIINYLEMKKYIYNKQNKTKRVTLHMCDSNFLPVFIILGVPHVHLYINFYDDNIFFCSFYYL